MSFVSTRGGDAGATFEEVMLAGLASDGGLFVPQVWPSFEPGDLAALAGAPYHSVVAAVAGRLTGATFAESELTALAEASYAGFGHPDVAPLRDLGDDMHLMELFWGPTLSFKDYALQLLGRLMDAVLDRRSERVTIVGATSGDTGSAAIAALQDRPTADVVILHPAGRVSDVQCRQMTTVTASNVHNVAIDGTFDDCQDLVKAMFADPGFRDEMHLSAVNSINFGRIMAQISYYLWAILRLDALDSGASFAVPTGNFGNVYAGYAARQMGLPVRSLIIGNNRNNGVTRLFTTGTLALEEVVPTTSPAMDIQVPSNLERLLFDISGRSGHVTATMMTDFRLRRTLNVPRSDLAKVSGLFRTAWMSDEAVEGYMGHVYRDTGILLDPHSVIAVAAGRMRHDIPSVPLVAIATAHPSKFPAAVERGTGVLPALPERLSDLFDRKERCTDLPNDLGVVRSHIRGVVERRGLENR